MTNRKRDHHKMAIYRLIELEVCSFPVANKHLENDPGNKRLAKQVQAIEDAIEEFCVLPVKKEYLRLKFWGPRIRNKEIAERLQIRNDKIIQWREQFLNLAGEKLGLIKKEDT